MDQHTLHDPLRLRTTLGPAGAAVFFAMLLSVMGVQASGALLSQVEGKAPLVIDGVESGDVYGIGRSIIVRGTVKQGALAFGGDVQVEGTVEGDVATIGGSVIQREGSRIGGDVIVIGGVYHHGKTAPGRNPASTTLMYAGFEQELADLVRNPTRFLAPAWSPVYLGQRLLAILFWFVASLALTAATPGAVSRAVARLQLTAVRVAMIGFLGSVVIIGIPACLMILPTAIGAVLGVTALLLLIVAYLFGRVCINAATGRWFQRRLDSKKHQSEAVALLIGSAFWTLVLSLPYIWPIVIAGLLVTSLGLALTARFRVGWRRPEHA